MASPQPKYRPSLTLPQMQCILGLCLNAPDPNNPEIKKITNVLRPMIYKASEGITQPAFISMPKQSLDDSLGFSATPSEDPNKLLWELYQKGIKMNDEKMMDALGYAFTNDLLTPEQEEQYTQRLMNSQP